MTEGVTARVPRLNGYPRCWGPCSVPLPCAALRVAPLRKAPSSGGSCGEI